MQQTIITEKNNVKKRKNINRSRISSRERRYIIEAIEDAKLELEIVRNSFNFISESKLIDSLIYKERDIVSRYDHLLQKAKEKGIKVSEGYIYNNNCTRY